MMFSLINLHGNIAARCHNIDVTKALQFISKINVFAYQHVAHNMGANKYARTSLKIKGIKIN